jgi:hypothetical protein
MLSSARVPVPDALATFGQGEGPRRRYGRPSARQRRTVASVAMVSAAGWRVERIPLAGADGVQPGHALRVSWRGYWQADCATSAEVATHVDLATLVPDVWTHVRPLVAAGAIARR